MRMLFIIYSGTRTDLVPALLNRSGAGGWTRLAHAQGAGSTGIRFGNRAWPGESQVYFAIVDDAMAGRVSAALRARESAAHPGESIHVATVPVERFY